VQQRAIEITTTTVVHIFWRYKLMPHSLAILVPAQTVTDYYLFKLNEMFVFIKKSKKKKREQLKNKMELTYP